MRQMRALVKFLEEEGWLDKAPEVAIPTTPKTLFGVFTDDELHRLFACPQLSGCGDQAVRNRAIWR